MIVQIAFKRRFLLLLLAGVTAASIFFVTFNSARSSADAVAVYAPKSAVMQQMVTKTNALRASKNLPALTASAELEQSALAKLVDMRTDSYWDHYAPDGTSFSTFIRAQQPKTRLAGENLARCFTTYDEAFVGLVNSPTHYKVLTESDFTYIGVASEITQGGCESIVMHFSR